MTHLTSFSLTNSYLKSLRMENNGEGFYCSQPAPKMVKSTEQIWRRLRKPSTTFTAGSTSSNPQVKAAENDQDKPKENPQENQQCRNNWSADVVDFYTNRDAPFCYTRFISAKLDRNFWGTLLGCQPNRALSATVIFTLI